MDIAEALQQALTSHSLGQLAEATAAYEKILAVDPGNFDSLYHLGLIAFQQSDYEAAINYLDRASTANATVAEVFNIRGGALSILHRYDLALESFDHAIALDPNHLDAINNRGGALAALGRHAEAIATFDQLITRDAGNADALISRGKSLGAIERYEEAIADFDRAIALAPASADAHYNRAVALWAMKYYDQAVASFDRAAALQPDNIAIHWNRGVSLSTRGLFNAAAASLERVVAFDPNNADAYNELGYALDGLRDTKGAMANFGRAIQLDPEHAKAHYNLGLLHFRAKHYTEALECYDRVIALEPDNAAAYVNRASALDGLARAEESIANYDQALAADPFARYARGKRLHDRLRIGQWEGFDSEVRSLVREIAAGHLVTPPFSMLSLPLDAAQQHQAVELFRSEMALGEYPARLPPTQARTKIRVGYFSADFRNHAVANLIARLIETHDRQNFEIVGISYVPETKGDAMTDRLKTGFDRFIAVSEKSDEEIVACARELEIDIALDLMGDTFDSRPGVFMRRAAPIQVNYLGHPATMGSPAFDYIVADPILIPPQHRKYYTEKIAYLPHTYQPNDSRRVISERILTRTDLGLPVEAFVFCAFNNAFKITPAVFDIWMKLLRKVEGSVLWLLEGPDPLAVNLRHEAEKRGVAGDRLIFAPRIGPQEHLARHRAADLFLDTFNYNAHTTASDALWAGLPVLTLRGETFAGRVAASLLTAIGLEELITETPAHYEALALELARDEDRLAQLRLHLEDHRLTAPLFDTARYARNIEAAYRHMWETYRRGEKPGHFRIVENGNPMAELIHDNA